MLAISTYSYCTPLTLEEAVQKTLYQSPKLKMSSSLVCASEGEKEQSELYPNPYFSYSVENVFGNKHWEGWEAAESRYELAQPLFINGQIGYRKTAALYRLSAAQARFYVDQILVLNELQKAFINVAKEQELLRIAKEQKKIAEEVLRIACAKCENGKTSKLQKNKAEIALAKSDVLLHRAELNLSLAREYLALKWGSTCPDFDEVDYPFNEMEIPKDFDECLAELSEHPLLIEARYESLAREQDVHHERAEKIPEVVVTVGLKTVRNTGEKGMILGASLPLPIFNRNQGRVKSSVAEAYAGYENTVHIEQKLENRLSMLHKELLRAYLEADKLKNSVLSAAKETFEFAKTGYEEGKFEYLELLDAEQTYFETQEAMATALSNYHEKRADLEYLNPLDL